MKERPILFSTKMVQAILDGKKTMTRRVIVSRKGSGYFDVCRRSSDKAIIDIQAKDDDGYHIGSIECPYGQPGDFLWVRETWAPLVTGPASFGLACYKATDDFDGKWKPSIHMPKWATRIWLEVTGVRVERLQAISDSDAIQEGIDRTNTSIPGYATTRFKGLWNSINSKRDFGWDINPWVWVIEFKRIEKCQ